jgi:hypothetical protein
MEGMIFRASLTFKEDDLVDIGIACQSEKEGTARHSGSYDGCFEGFIDDHFFLLLFSS